MSIAAKAPLQEAKTVRRKYRNVPTVVDGIRFDSKKEARRWGELQLLARANAITELGRQCGFPLDIRGHHICTYVADFVYRENGRLVVEDSKGVQTPEFKLKAKLMKAIHGIEVRLT